MCIGERSGSQSTNGATTPEVIVQAALTVLTRDGYQRLTNRAVAEEAGVNHALINYHFGGKQKLLQAMLERLESEKFSRQWQMYDEPGVPLSRKWRQAVEFFRDDLDDGYLNILHELSLAGDRDPEIAGQMKDVVGRGRSLLVRVASDTLPPLGIHVPPEFVVEALMNFWFGMEERILRGTSEDERACFKLLDFIGDWLEERERACLGNGERSNG